MESFYGGKTGASFTIKASFASVQEMVLAFNQGTGYSTVKYGEYCLINTTNKSSFENGLIYQRGYDYNKPFQAVKYSTALNDPTEANIKAFVTDPGGGAIYVGQICGPAGATPSIDVVNPTTLPSAQLIADHSPVEMVSGKTHNQITYSYVKIKDANDNVVGIKLGFTFPYHVLELTAAALEDYGLPAELASQVDSGTNPFYRKYNLTIPKGKHGQDFLALEVDENQELVYTTKSYENSAQGTETSHGTNKYWKVINTITPSYKNNTQKDGLIGYTISYTYGNDTFVPVTSLSSIESSNNGVITAHYTDNTSEVIGVLKTVDNVALDNATLNDSQQLKITYNNGPGTPATIQTIGQPINYIADAKVVDNSLCILYADPVKRTNIPAAKQKTVDGYVYENVGYVKGDVGSLQYYGTFPTLADLQTAYPNGITEAGYKGWLVSIPDGPNTSNIYAYSYDPSNPGWINLGKISANVDVDSIISIGENSSSAAGIEEGGLWYVVS